MKHIVKGLHKGIHKDLNKGLLQTRKTFGTQRSKSVLSLCFSEQRMLLALSLCSVGCNEIQLKLAVGIAFNPNYSVRKYLFCCMFVC